RWLERAAGTPHGLPAGARIRLVGDGLHLCPDFPAGALPAGLHVDLGPALRPDAGAVGQLALPLFKAGCHVLPEHAAPLYVRDKVAFTTQERAQGMGGNPKAPGLGVALRPMAAADIPEVAAIEASVQEFP